MLSGELAILEGRPKYSLLLILSSYSLLPLRVLLDGTRGASTSEYTYSYSDSSEASRIRVLGEDVPFFDVDGDFALAGVLEVAQLGAQVGAWVIVAGAASAAGATPELLGGFEPGRIMPRSAEVGARCSGTRCRGVQTSGRTRLKSRPIRHDAPN